MSLQRRILFVVMSLVLIAIIPTTIVFAFNTRNALIDQRRTDGLIVANLVAESARFVQDIPAQVERELGEQMIVQARIASHLVAVAEAAGEDPETISQRFIDITNTTVADEFWITDETGESVIRTLRNVEFTFSPDPEEQPQAHIFWQLLQNERDSIIQDATVREIDDQRFKYAGVNGIDQPRIVQIGYNASILDSINEQVGLPRLIDEISIVQEVSAIWVVDRQTSLIASSLADNADPSLNIDTADLAELEEVMISIETRTTTEDNFLRVMRPIISDNGNISGAVLVYLSLQDLQQTVFNSVLIAIIIILFVALVAFIVSRNLARSVTNPMVDLDIAMQGLLAQDWSRRVAYERDDEIGKVVKSFNRVGEKFQETFETFENTITERTRELQTTTQNNFQLNADLELTHDGAMLATSPEDADHVLQRIMTMIRSRYQFYAANIFKVQSDEIVMICSVMEDGHLLTDGFDPIPKQAKTSAIALAARLQEPVNIDDVTQSTVYIKHPLFPDTASEVCLPLVVGDNVVGVLDLQSSVKRAINTETMTVLQTLAQQLALVLQVSTLYKESDNLRTRTQEINAMRLEQMTSMASNIREPLYGMLEFSDFMLQGVYGGMNTTQSAAVNHIIANGDHLLNQINAMLGISHIEIENKRFYIESVPVLPIVEDIYRQVREVMEEHPVNLSVDVGKNIQPVWADQRQLRLILLQLLATMMRSKEAGAVELDVNAITDSVRIDLIDKEVSLTPEDVVRVGRSTVTDLVNNIVLVMRAAKDIVEAMGGKFQVESQSDGGMVISITLLMSAIPPADTES